MRVANYSQVERTRLARARGRVRALGDSNARGRELLLDTFEWLGERGVCAQFRASFNSSVDFGLISFLRYAFIEPHTFSIGLRSGLEGGVFHQFIPLRP